MKKGFTLVEMLVVVFIVGVLATVALPQYRLSVERARTTEAMSNGSILIDSMNRALMLQPNVAPTGKTMLDVKLGGGDWTSNSLYATKDFAYDISHGSYLVVTRLAAGTELYRLNLYNRFNPPDDGRKECQWSTDVGKYICDLFAQQGYTVSQYTGS